MESRLTPVPHSVHPVSVHANAFRPQEPGVASFVAGDEAARGGHDPPPRQVIDVITAEDPSDCPRRPWCPGFGRNLAVGHDFAGSETRDDRTNALDERGWVFGHQLELITLVTAARRYGSCG